MTLQPRMATTLDIWFPEVYRLGEKHQVVFDEEDREIVEKLGLCISKNGYVVDSRGKQYVHRVITGAKPGEFVDHINGDRLDNRRSNLRICTRKENLQARHNTNNPTGYKGVTKVGKRFRSVLKTDGKRIHLGYFDTPQEAAIAYNYKAQEVFKDFAVLNEVKI